MSVIAFPQVAREQRSSDFGRSADTATLVDQRCLKDESAQEAHDYSRAKGAALRMLAAREHSAKELRRKLAVKRYDPEMVARVLDELQSLDLQSDARFAESYVHARSAKGFGPMRIRQGLSERGVRDEVVDDHITHGADHWLELAQRVVEKRYRDRHVADRDEWNRRARFLSGRGFPADIIYRVLGHL